MIFRKSTLFDFFNGLWEYNGLTELAACKSFLSYDSAAGWQDYLFYFPVALITAIININIFFRNCCYLFVSLHTGKLCRKCTMIKSQYTPCCFIILWAHMISFPTFESYKLYIFYMFVFFAWRVGYTGSKCFHKAFFIRYISHREKQLRNRTGFP